jgi:hypothetical protein
LSDVRRYPTHRTNSYSRFIAFCRHLTSNICSDPKHIQVLPLIINPANEKYFLPGDIKLPQSFENGANRIAKQTATNDFACVC